MYIMHICKNKDNDKLNNNRNIFKGVTTVSYSTIPKKRWCWELDSILLTKN